MAPDKEGMNLIDRKVIHPLTIIDNLDSSHCSITAIQIANLVPNSEVTRPNPNIVISVEGMLWCCRDGVVINRQLNDDRIKMVKERRDSIGADFACILVIGKNLITKLNRADGNRAVGWRLTNYPPTLLTRI